MTPFAVFCCRLLPVMRPPVMRLLAARPLARPWRDPVAVLLIWLAVAGATPVAAQHPEDAIRFDRDQVMVDGITGRHRFDVELAVTPEQHSRGLMFRRDLAPDAGMLFLYPRRQRITMWMKNTVLPLDMLFIDKDGTIVRITEWTRPQSLATIESGGRVLGVLELNAGTAARLGLAVGDRVLHSAFD